MGFSIENANIIFVLDSLELGGAERQALLLARHLQDQHTPNVAIWGLGQPGKTSDLCERNNIPWRSIPFIYETNLVKRRLAIFRFAQELRKARPDILLPYTMRPNVLCGLTWRFTRASGCIWNQRDEGRGRLKPLAERLAVRLTPCFVSNSEHGAMFLRDALHVDEQSIHVVRNGVELPSPIRSPREWREQLGANSQCLLACMVANIHSYKDHRTLLLGWKIVTHALAVVGREAKLVLAGRFGDTYQELQALIQALGIAQHVMFLGKVDDISGLLQTVDLGVFSSRTEGCPNGVLECMASGLPVVGTDIPGIREAVGPANHELLSPPGDAEHLAETTIRLLQKKDLRLSIGQANRQRIDEEFSPKRMAVEMAQLMTGLLDRRHDGESVH